MTTEQKKDSVFQMDYSEITCRIVLTINFELESGVHVGGTDPDGEGVLRAHLVDGRLRPIIKDSSIKGVLRSEFARLEETAFENPIRVQLPDNKTFDARWSDILFGMASDSDDVDIPSFRSAINVSDIIFNEASTDFKTRVSINRKTRAVGKSGPFTEEFITPNSCGTMRIVITNFHEYNILKLLFFILDEIGSGRIALGGRSTSGLGRVRMKSVLLEMYNTVPQIIGLSEPFRVKGVSALEVLSKALQK